MRQLRQSTGNHRTLRLVQVAAMDILRNDEREWIVAFAISESRFDPCTLAREISIAPVENLVVKKRDPLS
jgi:hypothetical protein